LEYTCSYYKHKSTIYTSSHITTRREEMNAAYNLMAEFMKIFRVQTNIFAEGELTS